MILGETYDDQGAFHRYGQTVLPRTAADVAAKGQRQVLVGLRQDASYRTVLWLYNPDSDSRASLRLTYRALDGTTLGSLDFAIPAGRVRQIAPTGHPLPADFADAFTVDIEVLGGQLLSAAQVVNNDNNDPAYLTGENR